MLSEDSQQNGLLAEPSSQRPRMSSHHSNSLPSTPRPYARDLNFHIRGPSPNRGAGNQSFRPLLPDSNRAMPTLRPTNPACRFQSTQTLRRRIPYTIGTEPLKRVKEGVPETLDPLNERWLTESMTRLYEELLPPPENQQNRKKVVEKLKGILQDRWPQDEIRVSVFGSSGNLLCTSKSDVDICITMTHLDTVCALAEVLSKRGMKNVTCVHAKAVPIVKIWDPELQMACDLNVNNHVALKNTQLVKAYMELDPRVRPLAMTIKHWAKRRLVNEASGGTLSSYTWTLLVIHFLQTRNRPILPVLPPKDEQGLPRDDFSEELEKYRNYGQGNGETIGELLFGFFRRYGHEVEYEWAVLAVRNGKTITKREKRWEIATNNRLCVEEPFNTGRNLGNTLDDTAFLGIHMEIRQAFSRICEAKDLDTEVCEQYEFPPDEFKTIFERPPQQPRPVLSRSASQSGRGGRHGGSARGSKHQRQEQRNGLNNRRSSSAAAFPHSAHPLVTSPQLVLPEHVVNQPRPGLSDELSRLQQQLSAEENQLRYKQHLMSQHINHAHAFATSAGGRQPNMPLYNQQHRPLHNGYTSPRHSNFENPPGSAPLGYGFGSAMDSPVSMSHSSSQQGASTNPSSPMIALSTPLRRTLQRSTVDHSPGGTIRSHSQPARSLAPQLALAGMGRSQYTAMGMPQLSEMRQDQMMGSAIPRQYIGPYVGPYGSFYMNHANTDPVPREYLGYGFDNSPHLAPPGHDSGLSQVPYFDDLRRQSRRSSPRPREESFGSSFSGPGRPTSPLPPHREYVDGSLSSSLPYRGDSSRQRSNSGRLPDSGLLIVNGSSSTSSSARRGDYSGLGSPPQRSASDGNYDPRHVPENLSSDLPDSLHGSHSSLAESFDTAQQLQRSPSNESAKSARTADPGWVDVASLPQNQLPPAWIARPPAGKQMVTPSDGGSSSAGFGLGISGDRSPSFGKGGQRRLSGTTRPVVTPLDLSPAPALERVLQENGASNGPLLSPVQETRTPSPTSSRKTHARQNSRSNGILPPAPKPASAEENDKGKPQRQNGHAKTPSITHPLPSSSSTAVNPPAATNPWLQAGKKGAKKSGKAGATGTENGEPMPANESERKGG